MNLPEFCTANCGRRARIWATSPLKNLVEFEICWVRKLGTSYKITWIEGGSTLKVEMFPPDRIHHIQYME